MTTIATDGICMAGDGQMTGTENGDAAIYSYEAVKVHRLPDGSIVGIAGDVKTVFAFLEWIRGDRGKDFYISDRDWAALHLTRDGVLLYAGVGTPVQVPGRFAIGTGRHFALAAMDMGASPRGAIEVASHRCSATGGTITVEKLDGMEALPTRARETGSAGV